MAGESGRGSGPPSTSDDRETYAGAADPPQRSRRAASSSVTDDRETYAGPRDQPPATDAGAPAVDDRETGVDPSSRVSVPYGPRDERDTAHSPSTVERRDPSVPRVLGRPQQPKLVGDRYRVHRMLARGGQGEVWVVTDELLGQERALKIVQPDPSPAAEARFRREIQRTVLLAHPGVVPVFDRGEAADGRPFFVMRRVHGRNLNDVVRDVFDRRRPINLRRLVELLVGICAAVQHAHENRMLHRDLTPRNVMVSEFGEALVMDWGLAEDLPDGPQRAPEVRRTDPPGTPGYIAPECYLDADHLHRQVDVFGLGSILFKALTGKDPPEKRPPVFRDFPHDWADRQRLPDELVDICLAATAPAPEARLTSAEALRRRLVDWLDGARRRDEALVMVEQARALQPGMAEERQRVERLRREAAQARQSAPDHAPAEARYAAWALEDRTRAAEDALALTELEFERLLGAALTRVPELGEAHALLALHHRERVEVAEANGQRAAARRAEALVRRHQRGEHADWLAGQGRVNLSTRPSRARVTLHRLVLDKRRRVLGPPTALGSTPVRRRALARGSYLALIEAPGHPPVRYPIQLDREEHWTGVPPGESKPKPIPIITPAEGAVYVPAGPAWLGGDRLASSPLPRSRIWVDGFVIQRYSVTHRQWIDFLADLEQRGDHAGFERHLPRHRDGQAVYVRLPEGGFHVEEDFEGQGSPLDVPVSLVDWHSATAYAAWLAERSGRPWRLPTALEWEKAARGVDGRAMPWGDEQEPSWSCTVAWYPGRPHPVPVGSAPEDESVYGVRDMAGMIRNWCISSYRADPPADGRDRIEPPIDDRREVRGGSWSSQPSVSRPAGRLASRVDQRFRSIGVRLVYSVD